MTAATYSLNGGAAVSIPNGIFTILSSFKINVVSTSVADTGTYIITITVSDALSATLITSFTFTITNVAPRLLSAPPP